MKKDKEVLKKARRMHEELKEYREIHDELLRDMEIIENINNLVEDEYHELVDDE